MTIEEVQNHQDSKCETESKICVYAKKRGMAHCILGRTSYPNRCSYYYSRNKKDYEK
jgi:hypothetical protein